MKGDIPAPAFRLLNALPVRTHERSAIVKVVDNRNGKAVIIDGVRYESARQAKKALGVGSQTMENWLDTGRAKRA